ncbi:hypothetical protein F4553_002500 [Allocatelliglobosispora scoriae]|uniref:XRE family transcriptional regulator n=1 Tax=Allocatelliglobosispora scoriae TaxID=643052 RepID=A0A841BQM1_9ACTN|nr:helix-turn-helix domain-containing protein [Allocatelliglobosispora scoriae]MBB5869121.1 hypothetical protein [Allocatelliglobosispora scoriae]
MTNDDRPSAAGATSAADYVAALRALRQWSGLSYRAMEKRAAANGDVLPRSTVITMLSRETLPREELAAAMARACGCTPDEVDTWVTARRRLAAANATPNHHTQDLAPGTPPSRFAAERPVDRPSRPPFAAERDGEGDGEADGRRVRRWVLAGAAGLVGVLIVVFVLNRSATADRKPDAGASTRHGPAAGTVIAELTDDATIERARPDGPGDPAVLVSCGPVCATDVAGQSRILLRFRVSGGVGNCPGQATLRLWRLGAGGPVDVYRANSKWEQSTVGWNAQQKAGTWLADTGDTGTDGWESLRFPLAAADGVLALTLIGKQAAPVTFASSEHPTRAHPAELRIDYTCP